MFHRSLLRCVAHCGSEFVLLVPQGLEASASSTNSVVSGASGTGTPWCRAAGRRNSVTPIMDTEGGTEPARPARHDWAIRILTHELGGIKLQALTVDDVEAALARRTIPADRAADSTQGSRTDCDKCTLPELADQVALDAVPGTHVGTATRSRHRNVAALAELPTGAATERSGKSLTIKQARQLLAASSGTELEAMWTLMLYLGVRPGEAAGLSWNDIDFHAGTIHPWRARTTNTDGSATIGNTKTRGSIRTLEAPRVVLDTLEHHRQRQDDHAVLLGSAWATDLTKPSSPLVSADGDADRADLRRIHRSMQLARPPLSGSIAMSP